MTSSRTKLLCLTLVGLGLVISGYLLARTFTLLSNREPNGVDVCTAMFGINCDNTLLSSTSWFLGIPVAGWGIVFYVTLVCLLVLAKALRQAFECEALVGALLLGTSGVCGSAALATSMLVGIAPFCPLCMVIHAINLALVPALWHLTGRSFGEIRNIVCSGINYVFGGKNGDSIEARWKVVGFVIPALIAIVVYQWVLVESNRHRVAGEHVFSRQEILATYESTPKQTMTIGADDPHLGPESAPLRMVVFSNFQCPACRRFAQEINHLADQFDDELVIYFKHFPLSTICNPAAEIDRHPRSCHAAWAAEAAQLQGRFWEYHDLMFSSDLKASDEMIRLIAHEIGLDLERFETDRKAENCRDRVEADIQLGIRLDVDATPTVFLNERRITNLSHEALELLVQYELKSVSQ